jgi:hypothetical protein
LEATLSSHEFVVVKSKVPSLYRREEMQDRLNSEKVLKAGSSDREATPKVLLSERKFDHQAVFEEEMQNFQQRIDEYRVSYVQERGGNE